MISDQQNISAQSLSEPFLREKGACIENSQVTGFQHTAPLTDRHAPALSVLDHKGLLTFTGPDTVKFLQGQLTNNVELLTDGQYQNGAACTPKGRMYTSFTLLKANQEHFLMALHKDLWETTKNTLNKYAVFFKTELELDQRYICLGLSGQNIEKTIASLFEALPEKNQAIAVKHQGWLLAVSGLCSRYELWIPVDALSEWWDKLTTIFTPVSSQHWLLLDGEAVTPSLIPEIAEKYIPQHLNLPSTGGVSFRKGCYTGQEIVARMQNLGQLKSRCYRLTAAEPLTLPANTKLFNSEGKGIGEIIQCIATDLATEMLAVIKVDAAEGNNVYLGSENGIQLQTHPLPYIIDTKAELQL